MGKKKHTSKKKHLSKHQYIRKEKKLGKDKNPGLGDIEQILRQILDFVICFYIVLIMGILPIYLKDGYTLIATEKFNFFRRMSLSMGKVLIVPVLLYVAVYAVNHLRHVDKDSSWKVIFRGRITVTDCFALIYAVVLLVSFACTDYRDMALWGAAGWFMGLIPHLIFICIFFLISRLWIPKKWLFCLMLPVSAAAFLLGTVNRFDIFPFKLANRSPFFISTIGNINWYCGYMVSVMFSAAVLLLADRTLKRWQRLLLLAYTALGFVSLILQASDSGVVALAVVLIVMFCFAAGDGERMLVFWQEMVLLGAGCVGIFLVLRYTPAKLNYGGNFMNILISGPVAIALLLLSAVMLALVWADKRKGRYRKKLFRVLAIGAVICSVWGVLGVLGLAAVNTLQPGRFERLTGNPLFTLNAAWGSRRGATWSIGWKCFVEQDLLHKLVGVGPDSMWAYISGGTAPEIYAESSKNFGSLRLTNTHNEWLTLLVDTGILGVAGFGGMMISGIVRFIREGRNNPFTCACGFCLLAYTVNNIFSFQQIVSTATIFVIMGMGEAFRRHAVSAAGNRNV